MKKNFKNLTLVAAACVVGMLVSCAGGTKEGEEHQAYAINTFAENPYLAEIWYGDDYDPADALAKLNARYMPAEADTTATDTAAAPAAGGACSSWHKDNFHGRNIDWTMKDFATIIVHMPKNEAKGVKYASVGMVAGNPKFTKDFIQNNKEVPEADRNILAATIVDGMNECGVAINHNIVPYEGAEYVSKGEIPSIAVCRFVLDNCATAKEAVDYLTTHPVYQCIVKIANDYSHFMISDPTSSYVVEWIGGKLVATEFKADGQGNYISPKGQPAVMTNYFVAMAEKDSLASKAFFQEHPTGAGVERTQTIMAQLPNAKTVEDHLNICKSVWYRQFCQGKTNWATENAGNYGLDAKTGKAYWAYPTKDDVHMMDNDDVYAAAKAMLASDEMQSYYKDFNENWDKCDPANTYWYTQHSVVYDLKALKGYVMMQENLNGDKTFEITVK